MAQITVSVNAIRIEVDGDSFEQDVPIGAHVEYRPDDGSQGRTGNLNWIPGPETSAGPGSVQPGLYADEAGEVHVSFSKRMVVSRTPGVLTVTVYQDPELIGQEFAAQQSIHVA
jgi:hypothetical protein